MNRPRQWLVAGLAIGLILGLLYGWVLQPVKFVDTTPDSLRSDYKTDYVLMVAEAYQGERDLSRAERRLALLGPAAPLAKVEAALEFAQRNRFSGPDMTSLEALLTDFQQRGGTPEISPP